MKYSLYVAPAASRLIQQTRNSLSRNVGYAQGTTPNPTYEEVCSGNTNQVEVTRIVYDPKIVTYKDLLKVFWSGHDPTVPMAQGNDRGSQYRSGIYYYNDDQKEEALKSREEYQAALASAGLKDKTIVTEIEPAAAFYYAEDYHQQYYSWD